MDRERQRAHAVGQGAVTLAGLGVVLLAGRAVSIHAPPCPLRSLTGVPCPGCGMTRTADAVISGQVGEALATDAAAVLLLVAIGVLAAVHLVRVVLQRQAPPRWLRGWAVPVALGVLVAIHWGTTVVTGGMTTG
jgi:hypothetical protein